ncbi:hypothetical protein MRB53_038908 [Persea americana]|nr:hypothetical protein MRB53_038908 [Persea americana]
MQSIATSADNDTISTASEDRVDSRYCLAIVFQSVRALTRAAREYHDSQARCVVWLDCEAKMGRMSTFLYFAGTASSGPRKAYCPSFA